ncbi:MAG: cellulase family glycosylhydrolase, partial [Candidatus Omnitrophica bacterium]|nr:cellulase family glycosylhydrolase [Candidatus Omnitrophota bacterium]
MSRFFHVEKTNIVSPQGNPVVMRGVNVGGWLMMEGYILHAPNRGVAKFQQEFTKTLGSQAFAEFERTFRDNFIREDDFRFIAKSGFNSVRVPFHHNLIERKPFSYDPEGLKYLDTVLDWGKKYKLGIILDLHAAPGAQNHDWHSDSDGRARLWASKNFQKRVFALWEFLADRYRDNPSVLGYDLLNESVIEDHEKLTAFYQKLISVIRGVDRNHILFVEGNRWAQDVPCLEPLMDDNMVASIHYYEPLEFTFNFVPFLKYPIKSALTTWQKPQIRQRLEKYAAWSRKFS